MAEAKVVKGVLALELAGGATPERMALPQAEAGELAARIGRDLAKLVEAASGLDLVLAAIPEMLAAGAQCGPFAQARIDVAQHPAHLRLVDDGAHSGGRVQRVARPHALGALGHLRHEPLCRLHCLCIGLRHLQRQPCSLMPALLTRPNLRTNLNSISLWFVRLIVLTWTPLQVQKAD